MESQTRVSKRAPREFRNWRVQGNPPTLRKPFANPVPTLRQPFANLSPTLCQPFLPTFSANPSPTPSFRGPQALVQRHGLTASWEEPSHHSVTDLRFSVILKAVLVMTATPLKLNPLFRVPTPFFAVWQWLRMGWPLRSHMTTHASKKVS